MNSAKPVTYVDLHDARISDFRLGMGGELRIIFEHLVVFRAAGAEESEVWSYEAEMALSGVRRFELSGQLEPDDYVMDDVFLGRDGQKLSCAALLDGAELDRLSLSFFSGATVMIEAGSAKLELGRELKFMEMWTGPV